MGGSLLKGSLMLTVFPVQASPTGAAPGIREVIAVLLRGKGEPRTIRERDNLRKIFHQAQELS